MNHDDNNLPPSDPNPASAAELEARIVAWVAGEASAFETAELERLVAAQPELAIFKRRIEAVHGLVAEAARPEAASLRLAPERRAKLLATIGAGEGASAENAGAKPMTLPLLGSRQKGWRTQAWIAAGTAVAACLVVGVVMISDGGDAHLKVARPAPLELVAERESKVRDVLASEKQRSEIATPSSPEIALMQLDAPLPEGLGSRGAGDPARIQNERAMADSLVLTRQIQAPAKTAEEPSKALFGSGTFAPPSGITLTDAKNNFGPITVNLNQPANNEQPAPVTTADRSVLVWGGGNFNISTGETYNFQTPIGGSVLNKVGYNTSGAAAATIAGNLTSGGRTFIPADGSLRVTSGGASMNTQGTFASTLAESSDFTFTTGGRLAGTAGTTTSDLGSATDGRVSGAVVESNTLNLRSVAMPAGGKGTLAFQNLAADIVDTGLGGVRASPPGVQAGAAMPQSPVAPSDVVKLDAFVVSADRDSGYAASSLAGSRFSFGGPVGGVLNSGPSVGASQKAAAGRGGFAARPSRFGGDGIPSGGSDLAFLRGDVDSVAAPPPSTAVAFDDKQVVRLDAFTVSTEGRARSAADAEIAAKKKEEDKPVVRPAAQRVEPPADAEVRAAQEGVSTFSLHVGDVSFRLAQAALARGELPDPARIRPEEFYNALDYGDPAPTAAEKVTARIEQAAHPVLQQRNLVRIAVKVGATGRGPGTPLRLTVLLDTSGSMEREDRAATVRRALGSLASLLGPADRVTLIGFARTPRLLAEAVPGDQARSLVRIAAGVPAEGGTNLEAALKLAAELARRHRAEGALNRIVLLTDGAANLGDAVPARLAAVIEALRRERIALDACGIGLDGLDDEILEALTRHGDGRYTVLNTPEDADAGFAKKLAGAFRPAAENVKLQVRFNPARVGAWRLVGFEQHRMKAEDFRNDAVDAAELAAEEAAVALYQVEVLPQGEGEIGEVFVRFRDPTGGAAIERSWPIAHDARAPAFTRAAPTLKLAATAALLAEKLRGGTLASQFKLGELEPTVTVLRNHYVGVPQVEELAAMFAQARRFTRE